MDATSKIDRKVGILLGIGILLAPYIFSWFTLRNGYSKQARMISFSWLIIALLASSYSSYQDSKQQTIPIAGGILKDRLRKCRVPVFDQKMIEFSDTPVAESLKISSNEACEMAKAYMAFHDEKLVRSANTLCPNAKDINRIRDIARNGDQQAIKLAAFVDATCTPEGQAKLIAKVRNQEKITVYSLGTVLVGTSSCPAMLVSAEGETKRGYGKTFQLFAMGTCADTVNKFESEQFAPNNYPGEKIKSRNYNGVMPTHYTHQGKEYPFLAP